MPTPAQGALAAETYVAGNTIAAKNFTFTLNGSPVSITSARFAVSNGNRLIHYSATCAVAANVVTRPVIPAHITATWIGLLSWDIEVTLASGFEKTWIRGGFTILRTDQK